MDKDLARYVVRTALRSASELQGLLTLLKAHCSAEDYNSFASGIGAAIQCINVEVTDKALAIQPGLSEQIEASITRYGCVL
jgi:hypothetical protein